MTEDRAPGSVAVERAWRTERTLVLATLARRLGDLQRAEDAVQEAFAMAAIRWPLDGTPDRPGAWLTTTAWRKAIDALRRDRFPLAPAGGEDSVVDPRHRLADEHRDGWVEDHVDQLDVDLGQDDRLALMLTCAHPALSVEAQVALTLRHVAGLTNGQIAAAFLVPEATMDKRLSRARRKIRDARIVFTVPDRAELPTRLSAVHAVIYLIFTEGHLSTGEAQAVTAELCDEAVWLISQLHAVATRDPETTGLFALLLLQHARIAARQDGAGRLVPFAEQDRAQWDAASVEHAKRLLATTGAGALGPYQVQAAIALLHATAVNPDRVPWPRIADLYRVLQRLTPSPAVEINRAVAVGRADGPAAGLAILGPVLASGQLARYPSLHAAHADLLERAGQPAAAREAWRRAAAAAPNEPQRSELSRQAGDA